MTWYMCKSAQPIMDLDAPDCDDCAPAVIIDPEDRGAVERLVEALAAVAFSAWGCGAVSAAQAALREYANPTPPKPPKPKEPDGLGAVAQSRGSGALVRITPPGQPGQWLNTRLPEEVLSWDSIAGPLVVLWDGESA